MKQSVLFVFLLLIVSCAHKEREIKDPSESMRLTKTPETLADDLDRDSLLKGLRDHIAHFQKRPTVLHFGTRVVSSDEYVAALKRLQEVVEREANSALWFDFIKANFDFYEVFGKDEWGRVYITSYFNPEIPGSLKKTEKFSQALYAPPDDMVVIRMNQFLDRFPSLQTIKSDMSEQQSGRGILRGRLVKGSQLGAAAEIVPYYNREEIDARRSLKGKNLEICYVDPVDAYFLQIQGSGVVKFENGSTIRVGYASQNGYPYVAVGKYMFDVIPLEQMDMHKIEDYLKSLPPEEMQNYLNKNPSYIFFQKLAGQSLSTMGTEVIAGRTVATDPHYFPKGTLALLQFIKPQFPDAHSLVPSAWSPPVQRLVFDQDNGGAIRGPARVDLFLGQGQEAKQAAGVMKQWGKLLYLVPKSAAKEQ